MPRLDSITQPTQKHRRDSPDEPSRPCEANAARLPDLHLVRAGRTIALPSGTLNAAWNSASLLRGPLHRNGAGECGVYLEAHPHGLGPGIGTPDLRPTQIKTLRGREAVDLLFLGVPCPDGPAIFPAPGKRSSSRLDRRYSRLRSAPVDVLAFDLVAVELFDDLAAAFLEVLQVIRRPPVFHDYPSRRIACPGRRSRGSSRGR